MSSENFYPPDYINFSTMTYPNTITSYYTSSSRPLQEYPYDKYDAAYAQQQLNEARTGILKYRSSSHPAVNLSACPVYNSNTNMNLTRFMKYQK